MVDRLAESGAVQYAKEKHNDINGTSRIGGAGFIAGAYKDFMAWSSYNVGVVPNGLSARGGWYIDFYKELSSYGYNMTAAGDYFSTPDSVANSITGDISMIVDVALDDWTPTAVNVLASKDGVSANTRSYAFNVQTNGTLRFNFSIDGSNIVSATSTVAPSFANGNRYHVAVERESATGKVRFYIGTNHMNMTLLGTEVTATSGNIYNSTSQLEFGNLAALSYELNGKIFDSELYSGLAVSDTSNSVMKVDFDPTDWVSGSTWVSKDTGETWTLNGNAKVFRT
jgi:hypothetical protein